MSSQVLWAERLLQQSVQFWSLNRPEKHPQGTQDHIFSLQVLHTDLICLHRPLWCTQSTQMPKHSHMCLRTLHRGLVCLQLSQKSLN